MRLGTPIEIALLGELYGIHQPPNTGDGSAFDTLQNVQAWQRICEASRKEFELIYQRLGVTIQERGESFYNPFLAPLVEELMASGIAEESEGAKVSQIFLWPLSSPTQCFCSFQAAGELSPCNIGDSMHEW